MTGTPDPAAPGGTPSAAPGNDNWFSALPAEQIGYLQNKGWADADPKVAANKMLTAYQEYEVYRGVPKERILARPVDGDAAGQKAFWQQLGAPADPKDYSFDGIEFGDDTLTAKFTDKFRSAAAQLSVPKPMAEALAKAAFSLIDEYGTELEGRNTAQATADREALERDWGASTTDRFQANMLIANRGAERAAAELNLSPEDIQKFRDAIGASPVVAKIFNWVGRATGEASYVTAPNNGRDIMTRDQAVAERFRLTGIDGNGHATAKGDPEFVRKTLSRTEGADERRRLQDLNRIIVGAA